MTFLTAEEMAIVAELKKAGILVPFEKNELRGLTKNGGVAILCGDGDIDAGTFHRENVSHRPHGVRIFGGPPILAPSFREHDTAFAEGLLRNITWGMGAKKTRATFLKPHWPCGVGKKFEYGMIEWLNLMPEVEDEVQKHSRNIHMFFHVSKMFEGKHEEQNTYKLFIPSGGVSL